MSGQLGSAAVRRADAGPAVTHLMIMNARVVDRSGEMQHLGRQSPYGVQDGIRRNHAIMLCGHERDAGIDQRLLRVQHVEYGTLADGRFFLRAEQGDLRSVDLGLRGCNLGLARQ